MLGRLDISASQHTLIKWASQHYGEGSFDHRRKVLWLLEKAGAAEGWGLQKAEVGLQKVVVVHGKGQQLAWELPKVLDEPCLRLPRMRRWRCDMQGLSLPQAWPWKSSMCSLGRLQPMLPKSDPIDVG